MFVCIPRRRISRGSQDAGFHALPPASLVRQTSLFCQSVLAALVFIAAWCATSAAHAEDSPKSSTSAEASFTDSAGFSAGFLQQHCLACHQPGEPAGGLDLTAFSAPASLTTDFPAWVRIVDRVRDGEMPPKDAEQPAVTERHRFVAATTEQLQQLQSRQFQESGRVQGRRLTSLQLERTLQDLLGIDIPLATLMSEERRTDGFATVAAGQSLSHFQLAEHLNVVDTALAEAIRRGTQPPDEQTRSLTAREIAREDAKRRCREPEMIGDDAVVWASRLIFYGRLPATTAREDGWYRFTFSISARNKPADRGVWCTVRSGPCISSAPLLAWVGALEATEEPREFTFDAWLPRGHMLEIRPGDTTLKMARFNGGQVGAGEGEPQDVPGISLHGMVVSRIHLGPSNDEIRRILFDDLPIDAAPADESRRERRRNDRDRLTARLRSDQPEQDLNRLVRRFAQAAFRRPTPAEETQPFVDLAISVLKDGKPLLDALRAGYRAVLCSPRFMYFQETPGRLDEFALASRLSYFLWNSQPDAELLNLADSQRLSDPDVVRQQVDRMLATRRGQSFIRDFSAEWLDLRLIDFTEPDPRLYPTFDVIVQQSMLDETHRFLQEMLDQNRSVTQLIRSEHTWLNSRLARFYGIDGVTGDDLQKVSLDPDDHRGGVLTHGSVLKVTANGTTTSPVIRGVWIGERLLGEQIPAPPQGVPAIEPDIRGATSIRDLLEKHRNTDSCASCHVKIDPPGFALENFDPAGRFRTHYVSVGNKKKEQGIAVDASYELSDGQHFDGIDDFRALVCGKPDRLARNVVEKLLTYATGAAPAFADRREIESIVKATKEQNYGLRSILQSVVTSSVFQSK